MKDSLPDSTANRTQTYEKHSNSVIMPENFNNNLIIDEDPDSQKNVCKQQNSKFLTVSFTHNSVAAGMQSRQNPLKKLSCFALF